MAACSQAAIQEVPVETGRIAKQMLRALSEQDLPSLKTGIARVGSIRTHAHSQVEDEQLEILSAIAEDLGTKLTVPGSRRSDFDGAASTEVHVSLLRHLVSRARSRNARLS